MEHFGAIAVIAQRLAKAFGVAQTRWAGLFVGFVRCRLNEAK